MNTKHHQRNYREHRYNLTGLKLKLPYHDIVHSTDQPATLNYCALPGIRMDVCPAAGQHRLPSHPWRRGDETWSSSADLVAAAAAAEYPLAPELGVRSFLA
jgi:hypothetical protein